MHWPAVPLPTQTAIVYNCCMTLIVPYGVCPVHGRMLRTVAAVLIAGLFISQAACHGCPVADKTDPATVFSTALADRAVTSMPHQGNAGHPTKCRPDTPGALPGAVAARSEAACGAISVPCAALHLACSSRELLLLKSHLLI